MALDVCFANHQRFLVKDNPPGLPPTCAFGAGFGYSQMSPLSSKRPETPPKVWDLHAAERQGMRAVLQKGLKLSREAFWGAGVGMVNFIGRQEMPVCSFWGLHWPWFGGCSFWVFFLSVGAGRNSEARYGSFMNEDEESVVVASPDPEDQIKTVPIVFATGVVCGANGGSPSH